MEGNNSGTRAIGVVLIVHDIETSRARWETLFDSNMTEIQELPSGARVGTFEWLHGMKVELLMPAPDATEKDPLVHHLHEFGEGVLALLMEANDSETVERIAISADVKDAIIELNVESFTEYIIPGAAIQPGEHPHTFSSSLAFRVFPQ